MDSERIIMAAGLTAAAVVGAFIFWGPSTGGATGAGNRGRLAGLVNLGRTCFLNAVLHALAACPQFIAWLDKDTSLKESSLRRTLSTVLSVVNGTNKSIKGNYAPSAVINALERLGWVIPSGEQDAHELLNVLLTTLDEETNQLGRKGGCLSDALLTSDDIDTMVVPSFETDSTAPEDVPVTSPMSEQNPLGSLMSLNEFNRPSSLMWSRQNSGTFLRRHRWISRSCRHLQMSGPPTQPPNHPFSGTLTSQLRCTECGHRSPVRYDKFESLSLPLPAATQPYWGGRHKLQQLLTNFVAPEIVPDVQCEGCSGGRTAVVSRQIKVLNFGKLPICLCIHVSRNTWGGRQMMKRQDYVQFPMRLSLTDYTYVYAQYCHHQRRMYANSTSEGGSPLNSSIPMVWSAQNRGEGGGDLFSAEFRNIYQLAAVIVHTGDAHSGHFVTYRRGQHKKTKWYYTSDVEIREVSVEEVLQSTAYMLFYEKASNFNALFNNE